MISGIIKVEAIMYAYARLVFSERKSRHFGDNLVLSTELTM